MAGFREEISEIEQYILLFLADGERKRFSEILNYLKKKGFRNFSHQYIVSKLNRLMRLKFIFPRPHPRRSNAKTYVITPLCCKMPEEHAMVVHSPVFRKPVVLLSTPKTKEQLEEITKRGMGEIVKKVEGGEIELETLAELITGYREYR